MSIPICRVNVYDDFYDPSTTTPDPATPKYRIKGDYEYSPTGQTLFSEESLGLSSAKIDLGGSFIDVSLEIPLPNNMIVEAQYSGGALYDLLRYDNYWSVEYGWGDKIVNSTFSTFSIHNMMIRDFSLDYDTSKRFFNLKIDLAPRIIQILRNINLIHCPDIIMAVMGEYRESSNWNRFKAFFGGKDAINDPYNGPPVAAIIDIVLAGAKNYIETIEQIDHSGSTDDGIRSLEKYKIWSWPKEIKLNLKGASDQYVKFVDRLKDLRGKFYIEEIKKGRSTGEFLNQGELNANRTEILKIAEKLADGFGKTEVQTTDEDGDKKMVPIDEYIDIRKIGISTQLNASLVTADKKEIPKLSDFYFTFVGEDIPTQKGELSKKRTNDWERVRENLLDYDYIAGTSLYSFLDEILKDNGYILAFTPGIINNQASSIKQLVIPASIDPSTSSNEEECILSVSPNGSEYTFQSTTAGTEGSLYFGGKELVEFEEAEVDYFDLHSMKNVILSVTLDATGGKKTIATVRSEEALVANAESDDDQNKDVPAKDVEIYDFLTKLAKTVKMKIIGVPHIRPWDVVNFTALGELFTGRYRVITASHNISNGTYETELELMETIIPITPDPAPTPTPKTVMGNDDTISCVGCHQPWTGPPRDTTEMKYIDFKNKWE